ncbi:hypothetical protein HK405_014580, partial [Cladochytrium tenue]
LTQKKQPSVSTHEVQRREFRLHVGVVGGGDDKAAARAAEPDAAAVTAARERGAARLPVAASPAAAPSSGKTGGALAASSAAVSLEEYGTTEGRRDPASASSVRLVDADTDQKEVAPAAAVTGRGRRSSTRGLLRAAVEGSTGASDGGLLRDDTGAVSPENQRSGRVQPI